MAEKLYRSPQGSRIGRKVPSRNEKRNEMVANPESESELSMSYSSSSSSYIDISRRYPIPPKKGIIRTFFTAPSERRRLRRQKSRRILSLNNSSSSSINTDLAYGTGFLRVKKRRDRKSRTRREKGKQRSDDPDAAILALGAGLAAAARKKNVEDLKASRRTEIFNSSGRRSSRNSYDNGRGINSPRSTRDHDQIIVEEDWESASEGESEASSYVDSTLAFGDNYEQYEQRPQVSNHVESTLAYGGDYEQRRGKNTVVDPRNFGPSNSLHGYLTEPVGFEYIDPNTVGVLSPSDLISEHHEDRRYEERRYQENTNRSRLPLQTVFPVPTSDPTRFEATRGSVVSAEEPLIVRPGPVPLQQPQPITPVSQNIYDQASDLHSSTQKRSSSYGKSIAEAALAGVAGVAIGSMIAKDRSDDRKTGHMSDREDRRKGKSRDGDRSERRSTRSDRDDARSERSHKRESRDGKTSREERRREKRDESPRDDRQEKRVEKRRDSEREEDPDERRARRREERRAERSRVEAYDDGRYSSVIEPSTARGPIDPFQFQVADDAFETPDISKEIEADALRRGRDPSPAVYTVEREPDFSRMQSSRDHVYDSPEFGRGSSYPRDVRRYENREPYDSEAIQRENEHSTDAGVSTAFAAQVAAAAAVGSFRGSRSERRRGERRSSRNYHEYKNAEIEVGDDQDRIIQEDADRAYRESVIARQVASKVIRDRSSSPDAVEKYRRSGRDEVEEIQIVTPPGMEGKKQPGPYDAPNADFELDRVMDPMEFKVFKAPQITTSSPIIDSHESPISADYDPSRFGAAIGRRPLLTLVRPTPSPSPVPLKQAASPDPEASPPSSGKQRERRSRSQSVDDFVIDNKGNVKESSTPTASTISKAVTWGPNETKHYEIDSPGESRDEFVSPPRERSKSKPSESQEKSGGWGAVAGAIMGAAAGISMASTDSSSSPKIKQGKSEEHYEESEVRVKPEDSRAGSRRSTPSTVSIPSGSSMPGAFADDIDFAATLAAGLEDSGFDPNIVIDDPSYRKRISPPGSDDDLGSSYRKPFAETVSDLGETSSQVLRDTVNRGAPADQHFTAETHIQDTITEKDSPYDEDFTRKLNKKEQKKRDAESRSRSGDSFSITEEVPAANTIVGELESHVEPAKLSKKEQKKRDRAIKREDSVPIVQASPLDDIPPTPVVVAEPESYFEPTKKSKSKKSKRSSLIYGDETETTVRDSSPKVSVPIDAFDDIINAHAGTPDVADDWDAPAKKSKRKSKRDSERYESPSRDLQTNDIVVPASRYDELDPSTFALPMSTISDPEPADFPLPMSTMSHVSRDSYADERTPSKSFRDSGIFDSSDRDARPLVSATRYDGEELRKSKKKSRSGRRDEDDDTKSVASAPAYDDYEGTKKSKKKSRSSSRFEDDDTRSIASAPDHENDDGKKGKKSGFFGLFGISSSKPEAEKKRDGSPKAAANDSEEPKKKKKSKRSSLADGSESYGDSTRSVTDPVSQSKNGNGHGPQDDEDDVDRRSSRRRHRSKGEDRKSSRDNKDSFLARAGTLGAGVGLVGAAVAYAAHHPQSEATNTNPDGADISLDTSIPPSEQKIDDPEITQRPFRPSIDPQYGDLLPLPPSDPSSPDVNPSTDDLPELPDSRPETPETERRTSREKNTHLARRSENQPLKSPSQSAIPLRFVLNNRSTPTSPEGVRSSVFGPPAGATPDAVAIPRSRPRPTSWDSTKEFKPLYLLEHSRHGSGGSVGIEDQSPITKDLEDKSAQPSDDANKDVKNSASIDSDLIEDSATAIAASAVLTSEGQKDASSGQTGMFSNNSSIFEEPSPVEATSKSRTSYLLQDTPPPIRHTSRLASGEDSPTPMERDEPFDVSAARDMALDALSGSQANDNSETLEDSGAQIEAAQQVSAERALGTDFDTVSPSKMPRGISSNDQSSTIPLEGEREAQQTETAFVESEPADEDVFTKPKKGKNKKKGKAFPSIAPNPVEFATAETEPQSTNDTTDPKAESVSRIEVHQDSVSTQSPLLTEEPVEFSAAKSKKDKKKKKKSVASLDLEEDEARFQTQTEPSMEVASAESLAGPRAGASNREQEAFDISDRPEVQNQQETGMPPAEDADSTPKRKKGKKKKGSIQAWESEDPSTSIPPSGVDEPELTTEMSVPKSKKDKKKSKQSGMVQDVGALSSELGEEKIPAISSTGSSHNLDREENLSTGLLVGAIAAATITDNNETLKSEVQPAPTDAPSDRDVQAEGADGLAAGYEEDQLALAKQLQEEFGSGSSKKAKKGKKKAQSGAQTPIISTPLREEGTSYFEGSQDRGRELEDSKSASDSKIDALDSGYNEDQLELARQLQAEFTSESKKSKDKKKSRSTSRVAIDDPASQEVGEQQHSEPLVGKPSTDAAPSEDNTIGRGLDAGYNEDQLDLARQLQASFGSGSKKKKSGKRRNASQPTTPDVEPGTPILEEALQALEPTDFNPDSAFVNILSNEAYASGSKDDQLASENPPREEFETKSKLSKKDKKRQSLLRSSSLNETTYDSVDETSQNAYTSPAEILPVVEADSKAAESDQGSSSSKKSKNKKKRQSQLQNEVTFGSVNDTPLSLEAAAPPAESETTQEISKDVPVVESTEEISIGPAAAEPAEEPSFISKKSKKDRKKRQSQLQSESISDPITEGSPSPESFTLTDPVIAESEGDLSTSQKSEIDQKNHQSQPQSESVPETKDVLRVESTSQPSDSFGAGGEIPTVLAVAEPQKLPEESPALENVETAPETSALPGEIANDGESEIPASSKSNIPTAQPLDVDASDPVEDFSSSAKKSKKKKRKSQLPSPSGEEPLPEDIATSAQGLESTSREIEGDLLDQNDHELQKLEDDLDTKVNRSAETDSTPHGAEIQVIEDGNYSKEADIQEGSNPSAESAGLPTYELSKDQAAHDGNDLKEAVVQELEPSAESGSPAHDISRDLAAYETDERNIEDSNDFKDAAVREELEPSSQGVFESASVEDPEQMERSTQVPESLTQEQVAGDLAGVKIQNFENDLNLGLGKPIESKKDQQSSPIPASEGYILPAAESKEIAVPNEVLPGTVIVGQSVSKDAKLNDQEFDSASKSKKKKKDKKQGKALDSWIPEAELEQSTQSPLDAEESQNLASMTVEIDDGAEEFSSTSKKSKKKKKGKGNSPKDQEEEPQNVIFPDQEKPADTPTELTKSMTTSTEFADLPPTESEIQHGVPIPDGQPPMHDTGADDDIDFATTKKSKKDRKKKRSENLDRGQDVARPIEADASATPNKDETPSLPSTGRTDQHESSTSPGEDEALAATASADPVNEVIAEDTAPLSASESIPETAPSTNTSEILAEPSVPLKNEVADQPDHITCLDNNETATSEPIPQPPGPEDNSILSDATGSSAPAEPAHDSVQKGDIPDTTPVVESFENENDSFSTPAKKKKKDKKKKRASVAFETPDNETATGSSTPVEPVIEPGDLEGVVSSRAFDSPTNVPVSMPVNEDSGFSSGKVENSMIADMQNDDAKGSPTLVETDIEPSRSHDNIEGVTQPVSESKDLSSQPLTDSIEDDFHFPNGKESKNDKEEDKTSIVSMPQEDKATGLPTPIESTNESRDLDIVSAQSNTEPHDTVASQPSSEPPNDDFASIPQKKKEKKKKRASVVLDLQDNDGTTSTSTPIEPLAEPENFEISPAQCGAVDSSTPVGIDTSSVEHVEDQPSLEPSKHEFTLPVPVIESSSLEEMRGQPIDELTKENISAFREPSRVDVLLSQTVEPLIEDDSPTSAEPTKLDNLLSQIIDKPTADASSSSPDPSKLDNLLSQAAEERSTTDSPTALESINESSKSEDISSQPSVEADNEFVPLVGKKSKKGKKNRKSGLNQQSDNTGTSTPVEQVPSNLEDIQSQAVAEPVKDESPASVERHASSQPISEHMDEIYGVSSSAEPVFDPTPQEQTISVESAEPVPASDRTHQEHSISELQEDAMPSQPDEEIAVAQQDDELSFSTGKKSKKKRNGRLGQQDGVDSTGSPTPVEQAIELTPREYAISTPTDPNFESTVSQEDVPSQPTADIVTAPEEDDFGFSSSKKARKGKKRKSGLGQQDGVESTGASAPAEQEIEPAHLEDTIFTPADTTIESVAPEEEVSSKPDVEVAAAEEEDFGFSTSKKSKKDKKKRKSGWSQQESADNTGTSTPAERAFDTTAQDDTTIDSAETGAPAEDEFGLNISKKAKKNKKNKKGTVNLSKDADILSSPTTEEVIEASQEIVPEREVKKSEDENISELPDDTNLVSSSTPADLSISSDREFTPSQHSTGATKPATEETDSTATTQPVSSTPVTLEPDDELSANQADLEAQTNEPVDDEWGPVPSQKTKKNKKKDKKNRKGTLDLAENASPAESPTSIESSVPVLEDTEKSKKISLDATDPGAGDPKDDFGLSAGKESQKGEVKLEAFGVSEYPDTTGDQLPADGKSSKISQINLDNGKAIIADDLGLPISENDPIAQPILEEPSQLVEADLELTGGKKNKKNRKKPQFSDEPSTETSLPPTIDDHHEHRVEHIEATAEQSIAEPVAEQVTQPEDEWAPPTSKKSKKTQKKRKGTLSENNDATVPSTPTEPLDNNEPVLETSPTIDSYVEQDKSIISAHTEEAARGEAVIEYDSPVQDLQGQNNEGADASMVTERTRSKSPPAADPILAEVQDGTTTAQPEFIAEQSTLQATPLELNDGILSSPDQGINDGEITIREVGAVPSDEYEGSEKPRISLEAPSTDVADEPSTEKREEQDPPLQALGNGGGFSKSKKSKKKRMKSLLAASPSTPDDSTLEPETISGVEEVAKSKELQVSTGSSGASDNLIESPSPEAGSEFGDLLRKSSKRKSKKRGKSEVDLAAAKVVSDDLAASSQESGKVATPPLAIEDMSAPPLKRGHFELSRSSELDVDLATPIAEGVNPLLRAKIHGDTLSKIPESTASSTEQLEDKSHKLSSAAKLGAGIGLGVVAGLASKFEAPKTDTKKSKKRKNNKIIDNRSSTQDDLFDDPVLWEGAERTALTEPASATEHVTDDGFWIAPAEASNDEIPVADAPSPHPVASTGIDLNMEDSNPSPPRDVVDVPESTSSEKTAYLKDASLVDDNFLGERVLKNSSKKQSRIDQDEPSSNPESAFGELRIPKKRSKKTSAITEISESRLQDPFPPSSAPNLSPVVEEYSHQEPSMHAERKPPVLDQNRDSTLVDESPVPPQRGFEHDYVRDSGVQLQDWSTSPAERKPEAVSDQAIKRLSWPRVDDDTETIDLVRPHEPSVKAELDKHIDEIAQGVAAATATATARSSSPPREYSRARHLHRTPSPRSFEQPHRTQSPRSLGIIPRLHTPEQSRAPSAASIRSFASNLSSATPPLRRTNHQKSGDLRSLSQRSEASSLKHSEVDAKDDLENNNFKPVVKGGQVHVRDMADVYDGYGEGRIGSPISPTRPPSMRRRQSMKVLDLEAQLHQLAEENRMLSEGKTQAEQSLYVAQRAAATLADRDAEIDSLKQTIDWLHREVSRLTEVNEGLSSANVTMGNQHNERYNILETQHNQTARELHEIKQAHANMAVGMQGVVQHELENTLEEKNREIARLYAELEEAKEQIRELQRQILAAKANDSEFLTIRDEDYFDNACQQLCIYVQQWVVRFSKFSDMRACRLTSEISNEKIVNRLDNAVLDGSDVDQYLADRVKRRDIFMSMTMMMVWEFVFTRYLFGMDREQRQKLKSLEKILAEVGPQSAVHQWRATTLTLLAKREAFLNQREQDTEAVVQMIFDTLSEILPPPTQVENQLQDQLRKVMKAAVDLSIEMRTQRAEYMMLPPLQPEYDANGDLAHKFPFNAALMNERSGETISNEELEQQGAVVRVVLFPLVVKKGDDRGEGDDEIVVCPAQVLVAREHKRRSSGRNVSGHSGVMAGHNASKLSVQSSMPGVSVMSRDGSPF